MCVRCGVTEKRVQRIGELENLSKCAMNKTRNVRSDTILHLPNSASSITVLPSYENISVITVAGFKQISNIPFSAVELNALLHHHFIIISIIALHHYISLLYRCLIETLGNAAYTCIVETVNLPVPISPIKISVRKRKSKWISSRLVDRALASSVVVDAFHLVGA